MTLVRRSNNLDEIRDPFALARGFFNWDSAERVSTNLFSARFEVKETADELLLRGDLPGIKEEDVDISLDGDLLTISGTREAEKKQEDETYYVFERQYGSFSRRFRLPEHADTTNIEAKLDNGVLNLRIPKKEASKPRKIELGS